MVVQIRGQSEIKYMGFGLEDPSLSLLYHNLWNVGKPQLLGSLEVGTFLVSGQHVYRHRYDVCSWPHCSFCFISISPHLSSFHHFNMCSSETSCFIVSHLKISLGSILIILSRGDGIMLVCYSLFIY